jgi:hypothetical protein
MQTAVEPVSYLPYDALAVTVVVLMALCTLKKFYFSRTLSKCPFKMCFPII